MYKLIGFELDKIEPLLLERLYYTVRAIEEFHLKSNQSSNVLPADDKRMTPRVKMTDNLPPDLRFNIWYMYQNRFRKCLIRDVSDAGASVILPFQDRDDLLKRDRPFTALLDFPDLTWGNNEKELVTRAVIRYDKVLQPNAKVKIMLSKLNSEIHPMDAVYFPNQVEKKVQY